MSTVRVPRSAIFAVGCVVAIMTPPRDARADFGDQGVIVLDSPLGPGYVRQDEPPFRQVSLLARGHYFIVDRVSIGVGAGVQRDWMVGGSPPRYQAAGGLYAGYHVPLGRGLHLWPIASAVVGRRWFRIAGESATNTEAGVSASVAALWEPAPHVFVGLQAGVMWVFYEDITLESGVSNDGFTQKTWSIGPVFGGYFGD